MQSEAEIDLSIANAVTVLYSKSLVELTRLTAAIDSFDSELKLKCFVN